MSFMFFKVQTHSAFFFLLDGVWFLTGEYGAGCLCTGTNVSLQ